MGTGLMDTICPPSTEFAAYNKIRAPKQIAIYPDYGHEAIPGWSDLAFGFIRGVKDLDVTSPTTTRMNAHG